MSNASLGTRKPGRLARILHRLGFLSYDRVEHMEDERELNPDRSTRDLLLEKGWATADQLAQAEKVQEDPPSSFETSRPRSPTTKEILISTFQQARDSAGSTATESSKLGDVAAEIAKKSGTP